MKLLLSYTDGVPEAQNAAGDDFGYERIERAFSPAGQSGDAVIPFIRERLRTFVGDAKQYDDITMVAARVVG